MGRNTQIKLKGSDIEGAPDVLPSDPLGLVAAERQRPSDLFVTALVSAFVGGAIVWLVPRRMRTGLRQQELLG